jgi:periplasmic protein TonB
MKPYDSNEQEIFKTGIQISEPESWLQSIVRHFRQRREDRDAPPAAVTAPPDPNALDKFVQSRSPLASILWTVRDMRADKNRHFDVTAAPVEVQDLWSKDKSGYAGLLSVFAHAAVVVLIVAIPVATAINTAPTVTNITLLEPPPLVLNLPPDKGKSGGGGGGGMKTPTPPSKGQLPRGADKQILPPTVEIKNMAPDLVVEPTVVAPQLPQVPLLSTMVFGDPNGVVGPPSAGPGTGGGIGTGTGTGVGAGRGPGVGPGQGGGIGGGVFSVGGGVSEPQALFTILPEYSDDGRKGRIQGTVELLIVVKADGTVDFQNVRKSLGYGLDQKAIEAVRKWKFLPGKKDGSPVATLVSVSVNFSLR